MKHKMILEKGMLNREHSILDVVKTRSKCQAANHENRAGELLLSLLV